MTTDEDGTAEKSKPVGARKADLAGVNSKFCVKSISGAHRANLFLAAAGLSGCRLVNNITPVGRMSRVVSTFGPVDKVLYKPLFHAIILARRDR